MDYQKNAIVVNSSPTYKKGGSAGSQGVKFQISLLVVSLLNAFRNLKGWRLSTENKKAGKFDDVVLECVQGAVLMQAKHKENRYRKVTFDDLMSVNSKNDEFSLPKYFLSYLQEIKNNFKVKNIVICTNVSLDHEVLNFMNSQRVSSESILYYEENDSRLYTFKTCIFPCLKENVIKYIEKNLKNQHFDSVFTDEDLQEFLEHLHFYPEYPEKRNLEVVIETILSHMHLSDQTSCMDVSAKVMDWFQQKQGIYLTQIHAKSIFFDIWRDKYWQALDQYNVQFKNDAFNFPQSKNILNIVSQNEDFLQELKICNALKNCKANPLYVTCDCGIDPEIIEVFGLPQYTFLIIIESKLPKEFIKDVCDHLKKVLVERDYKKVVVVSKNNFIQQMGLEEIHHSVTEGFVVLEDFSGDTRQRLFKLKNVTFQGTDVSLEELFGRETIIEYNTAVDSKSLETLIRNEKITVGVPVLGLDEYIRPFYIRRLIKRTTQRNDHEIKISRGETFSEDRMFEIFEKVVLISDGTGMGKSTVLAHLEALIKNSHPLLWVVRIELREYTPILNEFLQNNKSDICVMDLLNSKKTTKFTKGLERFVFSMTEKVVLMLDGVDEICPDYTGLVLSLLVQCQKAPNFAKIFVTTRPHMVEQLEMKLGVKSFALQPFTNVHQIEFLTNYWSHNLKVPDELKKRCEWYAEALVSKMLVWVKTSHSENHFAGVPLQARMLSEIFQENNHWEKSMCWDGCKEHLSAENTEPNLPTDMDIIKLYEMFIKKKRKVFIDKGNPTGNVLANRALNRYFEDCLLYSRSLALELILGKVKCQYFYSYRKCDKSLEDDTLTIGIVQRMNDNIHFVHRTFAEYFVGESILMELQCPNESEEFQRIFFGEILLDQQFIVVRTFFDNFLRRESARLPRNIFQNYQFLKGDVVPDNVQCQSYLVHSIAKENHMEIMQLICQCPDFAIIKDEQVYNIFANKGIEHRKRSIRPGGVNTKDCRGKTPLHAAVTRNHLEMTRFLIDRGAELEACERVHGTPLAIAVAIGDFNIVMFLVERGADIRARGIERYPILYQSIVVRDVTITSFLLENILDRERLYATDFMVAYTAAYLGRRDVLGRLLERGLDVNGRIGNWESLIFGAVRGGRLGTMRYLVEQGANVNWVDKFGNTVLHVMAMEPSVTDTIVLLIELGVDLNAKNKQDQTALHVAAMLHNVDIVELLVRSGADVNVKDVFGFTPVKAHHQPLGTLYRPSNKL